MKNKSISKVVASVLVPVMAVMLAACGSSSNSSSSGSSTASSTAASSAAAASTSAAASSEAQTASSEAATQEADTAESTAAASTEAAASDDAGSSDDLLAQIKERGSIVIATEGDWSPWTYHDEDTGELVGLDVEIGKKIAEGLGVEADFEETDWDSILAGVDSGRFDIACNGVGYTEERAEKYTFSTPYVYTHKVLVVAKDNDDIKTVDDLAGKTTANSPSSTYAALAEQYGATVTAVSTLDETIQLLTQGRVDATINAQVSIEDYLKQHPDANIKVVQVLPGDPVAYPVRKGEDTESLINAVDDILQQMRDDGSLAEISVKYFGLDLTQEDQDE